MSLGHNISIMTSTPTIHINISQSQHIHNQKIEQSRQYKPAIIASELAHVKNIIKQSQSMSTMTIHGYQGRNENEANKGRKKVKASQVNLARIVHYIHKLISFS
ncbi:hypothetical protein Dimus_027499 [Dionaea muscipula]